MLQARRMALIGGAAVLLAISGAPQEAGRADAQRAALTAPAPVAAQGRWVTSLDQFRGALCRAGGETIQILDLSFGIGVDGSLGPAYLWYVNAQGEEVIHDDRPRYKQIVNDLNEMRGFLYLVPSPEGRVPVFVEEAQFAISRAGYLSIQPTKWIDPDGRTISIQASAVPPACEPISQVVCIARLGCPPDDCPQTPPNCHCTSSTGVCQGGFAGYCPNDGFCPTGTCVVTGVNQCGCQ
jgi:hypothetical protein